MDVCVIPLFIAYLLQIVTVQPRRNGKLGGRWNDKSIEDLLSSLKPYRRELRIRFVSSKVWIKSCKILAALGYGYNSEQAAEKIRNPKQDFRNAKQGKRKDGVNWKHFKDMKFLYDEPLESGKLQCCLAMSSCLQLKFY